jgi:very-short-patch-repair endonuclease
MILFKSYNDFQCSDSPPLEGPGEVKGPEDAGYITNNPHTCKLINEIREELKCNPNEFEESWEVKDSDDSGYIADNTPPPNIKIHEKIKSNASKLEIQGEVKESGDPGYITANPHTYKFIKEIRDELKSNPTEAELVLWEYLKSKKTGHKIRRQHIIDDFITDFVCLRKKVIIELDGKIHEFQKEYDEMRTYRLIELGFKVIRFKNEEVLEFPEKIALRIKDFLDQKFIFDPTPALPEGKGDVKR